VVQWRNRDKGEFEVRFSPADLPACSSPEVVQLLEQVIRGTPFGAGARTIDGHREVGYDREGGSRKGQCVVHGDGPDIVLHYVVEWRDPDQGRYEVRLLPMETH
jgi:hypothetical protein